MLDLLRTQAWWAVAALTLLLVALGLLIGRVEQPSAGDDDPPPPPAPAVEPWLVQRAELGQAVDAVLARRATAVGLTTSLHGAGGFGKTRLARMVCADRRIRRRFRSRVYLVTVGRDVRSAAQIAAKVGEVTRLITGEDTAFTDPDLAGAHLGRLLEQRPSILLVLDDVWEREQVEPFLQGAPRCVRLVTTRRGRLLEGRAGSRLILVDGMTEWESRAVLLEDVDPAQVPGDVVADVLARTGRWPLLLRLVNRLVVRDVRLGVPPGDAMRAASRRLRDAGPVTTDTAGMDAGVAAQREEAVEATIEAAVDLLPPGGRERYRELGVFAEDEAVPVWLVCRLWQVTASLSADRSHDLLTELAGLALITVDPADGGRLGLHDVHRDYLRQTLGTEGVTRVNAHLLDTITAGIPVAAPLAAGTPDPRHAWWDTDDGYMLDHAVEHLLAAGRTSTAEALASDLRWIGRRVHQRGPNAPIADLLHVGSPGAVERAGDLTRTAHLLQHTQPDHSLIAVLHSRLAHLPHWHAQTTAHAQQLTHPRLSNLWPLPDLPHSSLLRTFTTATGTGRSVVISPDGTWLASGSDRTVRIWDRATGTQSAVLTGHTGPVSSVAISPDGTWIASAGEDGAVRIWDLATGTQTAVLTKRRYSLVRSGYSVFSVAISPDGTWIASAGEDGAVRIWDLATGTQTAVLTDRTGPVSSVAISPDGTWIVSASQYGNVRIWDRATNTGTTILTDPTGPVSSVAISPDGTWIASASRSRVVIWDRATSSRTTILTDPTGAVRSVAISPDGHWLTTCSGNTVQVWDRATGTQTAILTGHILPVLSVAISPDGTWLASTDGSALRIWARTGVRSGAVTSTSRVGRVSSVAISPDGTWLASTDGAAVRIWDRATGAETAVLTGHIVSLHAVVIAPDGTWLASTGEDCTVRIWDGATGTETCVLTSRARPVLSAAISPDSIWLAIASGNTVEIWDRAARTETAVLTGHTNLVRSVAFSPDGAWLASASRDGTVRIWDRATGTQTAVLTTSVPWASSVAVSPDGTWLASTDGVAVWIWDRATGTETAVLTGHAGWVSSVAISPNGAWLASTDGGTIRIWDASSRSLAAMMRTESILGPCSWSPDSQSIVIGSGGGLYQFRFHPGL
ncbi:NB-ARC domain-containing protein [Streptomyces sp. NPDC051577]|uniref:NB-ARC domain-containing protein n=1 Tax=Streptomyces sp. NPDC051577 TaxID=3155166 RepID=UPI0034494748